MPEYTSIPVPFIPFGNGRCLTEQQLCEDDCLRAFVQRFPESFEYDRVRRIFIFVEPDQ